MGTQLSLMERAQHFLAHVYCGQTVTHLSNCWALVYSGNRSVCADDVLDVESFLLKTLQGERLSDAARCEKDSLLNKLKALQDEYPQLRRFDSDLSKENETTTTTSRDSPRQQTKQIVCTDESDGE